ncbi:Transcription factor 25 [Podila humilis]|nr:Transcription factor 25 [Podila humilis]
MSSRAMKKLLRDSNGPSPLKEDILTTKHENEHNDEDGEEDEYEEEDYVVKRPPARNLFALLDGDDDDQEDKDSDNDDEVEEEVVIAAPKSPSKKSKKKKKSKAGGASGVTNPFDLLKDDNDSSNITTEEPTAAAHATAAAPSSKTKSNKNKKKKGKAKTMDEMSIEEFERSLQQMNQQLGSLSDAGSSSKAPLAPLKQLLAVDTRFLDADAEMKKMFGARVVNSEIKDRRYAKVTKKALLAQPRGTWPVRKASGLSMALVETDKDNVTTFKIHHSDAYQRTQLKFLGAVASYDPNNLVALLRESPFHIDTLLQLSEVSKHNGDNSLAGEFIEQALFAFEKSFHSLFNIGSGAVRLNFMDVENRSFFLAIHRHIQFLGRRGCWRTAFEFNKLLLSLDPVHDELGALLSIDFYALKAQEYSYLVRMYERLQADHGLTHLPNFAYSIAMARFHLETAEGCKDHAESSALLQRAIILFPTAAPLLADQGGFSIEGEMAYEAAFFPAKDLPKVLDLYIHLFVARNFALWKEPEVISWLKDNVKTCVQTRFNNKNDSVVKEASKLIKDLETGSGTTSTPPSVLSSSFSSYAADGSIDTFDSSEARYPSTADPRSVPLRVCRHVLVSDFNALARYLPQEIVTATMHMHDPLPPAGSRNIYEEQYEIQRSRGLIGGARDAAQTVLEEVIRRLIPGGAAGLREEELRRVAEAVQMLEARGAVPRDGGLPGAFPGYAPGVAAGGAGGDPQLGALEEREVAGAGEEPSAALNTAEGQSVFRSLTDMMQLLGFGAGRNTGVAGGGGAVDATTGTTTGGSGGDSTAPERELTQEETRELVAAMMANSALGRQEGGADDDDEEEEEDENYDYEEGEGVYDDEDEEWEPYDPAAYS